MVPLSHVLHSIQSLLISTCRECFSSAAAFPFLHPILHSALRSLVFSPPIPPLGIFLTLYAGVWCHFSSWYPQVHLSYHQFIFFLLLALQSLVAQLAEKSTTFSEGSRRELTDQPFRAQCKTVQPVCSSTTVKKLIPSVLLFFLKCFSSFMKSFIIPVPSHITWTIRIIEKNEILSSVGFH